MAVRKRRQKGSAQIQDQPRAPGRPPKKTPFDDDKLDPAERFERDYKAKYGELPPLPYMTNFYDGIVIAALAAAKAQFEGKTVNGVAVRDNLRAVANPGGEVVVAGVAGLKRALELIKAGTDVNYEGAAGSQDFDEYGDTVTPIEIWKYVEQEPYIETVRFESP